MPGCDCPPIVQRRPPARCRRHALTSSVPLTARLLVSAAGRASLAVDFTHRLVRCMLAGVSGHSAGGAPCDGGACAAAAAAGGVGGCHEDGERVLDSSQGGVLRPAGRTEPRAPGLLVWTAAKRPPHTTAGASSLGLVGRLGRLFVVTAAVDMYLQWRWDPLLMQGAPESLEYRLFFKQKGVPAAFAQTFSSYRLAVADFCRLPAACCLLVLYGERRRYVSKLIATCLLVRRRRGHIAVARHPAAGQGRHLQLRVRDPQGDGCQDGGRHGGFSGNPATLPRNQEYLPAAAMPWLRGLVSLIVCQITAECLVPNPGRGEDTH